MCGHWSELCMYMLYSVYIYMPCSVDIGANYARCRWKGPGLLAVVHAGLRCVYIQVCSEYSILYTCMPCCVDIGANCGYGSG